MTVSVDAERHSGSVHITLPQTFDPDTIFRLRNTADNRYFGEHGWSATMVKVPATTEHSDGVTKLILDGAAIEAGTKLSLEAAGTGQRFDLSWPPDPPPHPPADEANDTVPVQEQTGSETAPLAEGGVALSASRRREVPAWAIALLAALLLIVTLTLGLVYWLYEDASSQLAVQEQLISTKVAELASANADIANTRTDIDLLQQQLEGQKDDVRSKQTQLTKREGDLEVAAGNLSQLSAAVDEAQETIRTQQLEISRLKDNYTGMVETAVKLRDEITRKDQKIADQERNNRDLVARLNLAEKTSPAVTKSPECGPDIDPDNYTITLLKQQNVRLTEEIAYLKAGDCSGSPQTGPLKAENDSQASETEKLIWGAGVVNSKGRIQIVVNQASREDARSNALRKCRDEGGRDCRIIDDPFNNLCMSIAKADDRFSLDNFGVGWGTTPRQADMKAVADCEDFTLRKCEFKFRACSPGGLSR